MVEFRYSRSIFSKRFTAAAIEVCHGSVDLGRPGATWRGKAAQRPQGPEMCLFSYKHNFKFNRNIFYGKTKWWTPCRSSSMTLRAECNELKKNATWCWSWWPRRARSWSIAKGLDRKGWPRFLRMESQVQGLHGGHVRGRGRQAPQLGS